MKKAATGRGAWWGLTGRARAHSPSSWPICCRRAGRPGRRRATERSPAESWTRIVSAAAAWVSEGTSWNGTELAGHLDACWPLHPIAAALLGPLFHSRSAQNERSLFAFLSAGEPLSFRDFLRRHGPDSLYTVDRLYDYVAGILGGRMPGRDGRRWAAIETAIRRLPPESDAVDEQVLKAVGLLGMLGDRVGLRASSETVAACVDDGGAAERSLERLKQRSILVYRQFRDAFQIWEGSDLDLDDLVLRAGRQLPSDFSVATVLQRQAPRTPLVARRHLFQTGTLRFFDVHFVEASRLIQRGESNPSGEGDGIVLLALPRTEGEREALKEQQGTVSPALERLGAGKPVVLVVPETSVRLSQLVQELAAAQLVRTSTPELQSDPVARTELVERIQELDRHVASEVDRVFDPRRSEWFIEGERLELSSWRSVSSFLSALCDAYFSGAPPIRNELLNRRALSPSAARARRNLMEAMILRGDVARLGFEGNPPEISMYRSLLEQHGFHRQRGGAWRFGPPRRTLRPLWTAVREFLRDSETGRRPLTELYDRLRRPPFGIKDGPLPIIVVAALLARASRVAVYERGSFVPAWTPSHAERLIRSPDGFEVGQCRIDGKRREVLERLAERLLPSTTRKPSLLGVVRGLVQFVAKLTPYARRTLRISDRARDIRETLVRAREPARLVFDDLPAACGSPPFGGGPTNNRHRIDEFVTALEAGLREVRDAYPALLARSAAALANHLSLPGNLAELAAELRSRASLVEDAAVEPRLRSFVVRASDDALGPDDMLASLLTQLADKPPPEWSDADEDQFEVRLAYVARAFRGAESLLVASNGPADGQPLLRLSVARRGRPEQERVLPLRAAEESRIAALRDRILDTVRQPRAEAAACDSERALAALALAAESLLDGADRSQPERDSQ